jgi:cytochrome P450
LPPLANTCADQLFAELLPRLTALELGGRPEWTQTLFVGGLKRLPIRYELTRRR